jgi:hypothetical protein
MTIDYLDGFEPQFLDAASFDTSHSYFVNIVSLGAFTWPNGRTGVSMKVIESGAAQCRAILGDLPASQQRTWSFYFRIPSAPSIKSDMWSVAITGGASGCGVLKINTNGTIELSISGAGPQTGPNVADNAWHRVDMWLDSSGTTHTIQWRIDGSAQTNVVVAGQVARDPVRTIFGSQTSTHTLTVEFDDFMSGSNGATDYPLNGGQPYSVRFLVPNADGTHVAGTNVIEDQAGNDIGTVPAWSLLDEIPGSNSDYVRQVAIGASNYAEIAFEDTSETAILAACGYLLGGSPTATNPNGTMRIVDSGGATLVDLYSGNMGGGSGTPRTVNLKIPDPGGDGWSQADLNGIKLRVGFSSSASGSDIPAWWAAMIQYAVTTPVAPTARRLRTVSTPLRW